MHGRMAGALGYGAEFRVGDELVPIVSIGLGKRIKHRSVVRIVSCYRVSVVGRIRGCT